MRIRRLFKLLMAPVAGAAGLVLALPASPALADPPGNNGTVKVGEIGAEGNANDPHVACQFELRFFNFDDGQTATITFRIHPPSGQGDVLFSVDNQLIGGQDPVVIQFDGLDFGLFEFDRHPNQGFHVRLDVDLDGGGQKHKVFWVDCKKPKHKYPPRY